VIKGLASVIPLQSLHGSLAKQAVLVVGSGTGDMRDLAQRAKLGHQAFKSSRLLIVYIDLFGHPALIKYKPLRGFKL
jgi:hypothetical protein